MGEVDDVDLDLPTYATCQAFSSNRPQKPGEVERPELGPWSVVQMGWAP